MQSLLRAISGVVLLGLTATGLLFAQQKGEMQNPRHVEQTQINYTKAVRQGFGMKLWMNNKLVLGAVAKNESQWSSYYECDDIGLESPPGFCDEHLYSAGPMIGGVIDGVRYVSYSSNALFNVGSFHPDTLDTVRNRIWETSQNDTGFSPLRFGYYKREPNKRCVDDDGDHKVDEDDLDGFDNDSDWVKATDDLGADGLPDSLEVGCFGEYNKISNTDPACDNYEPMWEDLCYYQLTNKRRLKNIKHIYTQGNGIPDFGEPHVDEDYGAYSDHDIYITATDTFRFPVVSGHTAMGIKVLMKSYAWESGALGNILPIEYYFTNVGKKTIRDVYVGYYADMDIYPVGSIGGASNNYSGYIDSLRTAYSYNSIDRGMTPMGITLLEPLTFGDAAKFIFQWFEFDPPCGSVSDDDFYRCISCEAFNAPDNCIKEDGSSNSPSDTRFIFSYGPYSVLKPGETLKMTIAFVTGERVFELVRNAAVAHKFSTIHPCYPKVALPSPCLDISVDTAGVRLNWGPKAGCWDPMVTWDDSSKAAELRYPPNWRWQHGPQHIRGGRIFEGFRLYRSEDPNGSLGSFTLLKEYDMLEDKFNSNLGIDTEYVDRFAQRGKTYWYAVTSFPIPELTVFEYKDQHNRTKYDSLYIPGEESPISANAQKVYVNYARTNTLGEVLVVPNPYRGDIPYTDQEGYEGSSNHWNLAKRMVRFIRLPAIATIRIYTLAGEIIRTIQHDDQTGIPGQEDFHLYSESGKLLAAGIFIFTVESDYGKQIGKFVVIQ